MDRSSGDDFGARSDRAENRHVAFYEGDRLAGANRILDQERGWLVAWAYAVFGCRSNFRLGQFEVLSAAGAAQDRRKIGSRFRRLDPFNSEHPNIALLEICDQMRDAVRT